MPTNMTNWRDAEHNIWGFQHVKDIFPTAHIRKSHSHQTSPLESEEHTFDDFQLQDQDGISLDLHSFFGKTETDGIVMLRNGKLVYEYYDRTNTPESTHALFSISKSITGLVIGILEKQGMIDTSALVSLYIPELAGSTYENVTVQQALDMRAGLEFSEEEETQYKNATGMFPLGPGELQSDLHSYIPTIKCRKSDPVPGLDGPPFDYLSVNSDLMGWVIERATGKKFADVVSDLLWQPMGAESDAYTMLDRSGNARAAAGICATARDLARVGQFVLQSETENVVLRDWVRDMMNNGSIQALAAVPEGKEFESVFDTSAYRSLWHTDQKSRTLMASGAYGQMLLIDFQHHFVMAKTSSQQDRSDWDKMRLTIKAFQRLARITAGEHISELI